MLPTASLALLLMTSQALAADPGRTRIMYFNPSLELNLAKRFHERRMPWPVLRIGIVDSGKHRFALIRIRIKKGAGRSEVAREVVECGRLAFKLVPSLEQADIDAVLEDDTRNTKAAPLFAVSLRSQHWATYNRKWIPEKWLTSLGALTISPQLEPDRDPCQVATDTLWDFYHDAYNRVPITRSHPKKDRPQPTRRPRQPR